MQLLSLIKTPLSYIGWFVTSLFFTLICIPLTFLPAPKRYTNPLYFFLTTIWGKCLMFFSFLYIPQRGEENFPTKPAIIIMNHTSCLDIFLMESIMKNFPHIWLSKISYTNIPLFSILLNRMHVPVNRKNTQAASRALLKAYKQARDINSHIVLFPEGTRHDDGKIHPFTPGFALLAKKLNRPVIPIAASGLHKILPKGKILINYDSSDLSMTIGPEFRIKPDESIEDFVKRVQGWFPETLAKNGTSR